MSAVIQPGMEEVGDRIQTWRQSRTKSYPMPPALWNEVVELAKDHGINATSRAFGLNATRIRVRMGSETDGTKVTPGAFMELSGAEVLAPDRSLTGGMHSVSSTGTEIELTSNHGNRLTIRLGSGQSLDFASLIRAFRD